MSNGQDPSASQSVDVQIHALAHQLGEHPQDEPTLIARLLRLCRDEPPATWQAMSLLDQLYRRGVLSRELFGRIQPQLSEIAFGASGVYLGGVPSAQQGDSESVVLSMRPRARTQLLAPAANRPGPLRPGMWLQDRYLIVEPLAVGLVCNAYRAMDKQREALPEAQRYVVLRCLHERLQHDPHSIAALQTEFALLQNIAHRNIAKAYDLIESSDAHAIVLAGGTGQYLDQFIEGIAPRHLPVEHALAIVREIGLALAYAHARGVMHGQLHPGRIFITDAGEVRIYDFAQADAWTLPLAQHSMDLKAQAYCSPQRANSPIATASDDIYSLARIAYDLLGNSRASSTWWRLLGRDRFWMVVERGMAPDSLVRGNDVRAWLAALDMQRAAYRLPSLASLTILVGSSERSWLSRSSALRFAR